LFNTLNNLYSLILKKSDNAKDVVLKLSDLMSYMLHDAKAKLVVLSKEINYINNYIALEKIRFGNRFEISFNTFGNINKYQIPPLLILPFIENSFKHGVSGEIDGAWITIEISVEDEDFTLKIENSISDRTGTKSKNLTNSGIGLNNAKRRLNLLYKENYELKIIESDTYLVILKLKPEVFSEHTKIKEL